MTSGGKRATIRLADYDAVLFDLDGVLTATAKLHAAAWKQMFDEYLRQRSQATGEPFAPFTSADYQNYVDGKLRYDGVRAFLASRGIRLPEGDPSDPPEKETICGLGNRKNKLVTELIASRGVDVFPGSVNFARRVRDAGLKTAVVSSSKNCELVLRTAGLETLFDLRLDGWVAARLGLRGKPAPDTYLEAARQLGVKPGRAVVIEDALSGVEAGRAGGFGLVIGVDRKADAEALRRAGADMVVEDLDELELTG